VLSAKRTKVKRTFNEGMSGKYETVTGHLAPYLTGIIIIIIIKVRLSLCLTKHHAMKT
jgi:hypothetical protein